MLRSLKVRNFAVVEAIDLKFDDGLTVFTGQTGAGKSILIEALGFLLGNRGSLEWLRSGAQRLEAVGTFDRSDFPKDIQARLRMQEETIPVRRELDASGKTRAYIHNQSVSLAVLSQWGDGVVDFHGQHEHQTLLKGNIQLDLLDGFAGMGLSAALEPTERYREEVPGPKAVGGWPTERYREEVPGPKAVGIRPTNPSQKVAATRTLRDALAQAHGRWAALTQERKSLDLSEEERRKHVDLYRYQLSEIQETDPRPGEEEELDALLPKFQNAERLATLSAQAYALLYEVEGSVQANLLRAERCLEELARIDAALAEHGSSLAQARVLVQDVSSRLSGYRGEIEAGPERLDEIHSRLDRIGRLKKKYGSTIGDILAYRDRIRTELSWLENSEGRREEIDAACAKAEAELARLCAQAHQTRMGASSRLSQRVTKELKLLGMPLARFSVSVEMEEGRYGPSGADQAEFLIAPNPGEPLKAIKAIASGGELSRVMLALKTVLADNDTVRILVFDEVDSGVGGEVGRAVGERLSHLARSHQIFCVTHLPQVASFAQTHFQVSKEVADGRSFVRAQPVDGSDRLDVLARMLGGRAATALSRKHAQELLESSR